MVRLSHRIFILPSYLEGGDKASLPQDIQKWGLASWPKAMRSRPSHRAHQIASDAAKSLLTQTVKRLYRVEVLSQYDRRKRDPEVLGLMESIDLAPCNHVDT